MKKSPDAFRTISEVAEWLGVQTHVLRFWESKFTQVKPVKRAGGRRYYRPTDMALLGGIKRLLHDDGMTIKGVQKLLREEGVSHVSSFSQALDSALEPAEEQVSENVVRFTARPEDAASAEPAEPAVAPVEDEPVAVPVPEEAAAAPETAPPGEPATEVAAAAPDIVAPSQQPEGDSSPLPAFLTQPMGGTPDPARPRIVNAPDPAPDAEITAAPGVLAHLSGLGPFDPEVARQLTPLVARLAVLRDRLGDPVG